eukprot:SAG22_NODE_14588_length_370_cov_1.822878_1_plen_40_part_10
MSHAREIYTYMYGFEPCTRAPRGPRGPRGPPRAPAPGGAA